MAAKYWRRAGRVGLAHYRAAEIAKKRSTRIGIPNVIITAVVATSIFSTLNESKEFFWVRIATGVIALAAAVLSALQAFLNFGDLAEKHHIAGAKYANVRRTIDLFLLRFSAAGDAERDAALQQVEEIVNTLSSLSAESPSLTEAQYQRGKSDFDSSNPETRHA